MRVSGAVMRRGGASWMHALVTNGNQATRSSCSVSSSVDWAWRVFKANVFRKRTAPGSNCVSVQSRLPLHLFFLIIWKQQQQQQDGIIILNRMLHLALILHHVYESLMLNKAAQKYIKNHNIVFWACQKVSDFLTLIFRNRT